MAEKFDFGTDWGSSVPVSHHIDVEEALQSSQEETSQEETSQETGMPGWVKGVLLIAGAVVLLNLIKK